MDRICLSSIVKESFDKSRIQLLMSGLHACPWWPKFFLSIAALGGLYWFPGLLAVVVWTSPHDRCPKWRASVSVSAVSDRLIFFSAAGGGQAWIDIHYTWPYQPGLGATLTGAYLTGPHPFFFCVMILGLMTSQQSLAIKSSIQVGPYLRYLQWTVGVPVSATRDS